MKLNQVEAVELKQIKRYIRERLLAEFACKKRGAPAKASKEIGISTAHMTNLLSEKSSAGEAAARKVAAYWGLSHAELERLACGDSPPPAPARAQVIAPDLDTIRDLLREEIRKGVAEALAMATQPSIAAEPKAPKRTHKP